jgi:hypothetical protein
VHKLCSRVPSHRLVSRPVNLIKGSMRVYELGSVLFIWKSRVRERGTILGLSFCVLARTLSKRSACRKTYTYVCIFTWSFSINTQPLGMDVQVSSSTAEFRIVVHDVFTVDDLKTLSVYKIDEKSGNREKVVSYDLNRASRKRKLDEAAVAIPSALNDGWPAPAGPRNCAHCDRAFAMSGVMDKNGKRVPRAMLSSRLRCHQYRCEKKAKRRLSEKVS